MSQKNQNRKWLNVIIIVISALILAFMLIGKLMERDENQPIGQAAAFFNRSDPMHTAGLSLQKIEFEKLTLSLHNEWQLSMADLQVTNRLSSSRIEEIQSLWQQVLTLPTEPLKSPINSQTVNREQQSYWVKLYFKSLDKPLNAQVIQLKKSHSEVTNILFPELKQQLRLQGFYFKRLSSGTE